MFFILIYKKKLHCVVVDDSFECNITAIGGSCMLIIYFPLFQRSNEPVELSSSACMIAATPVTSEHTLEEIREQRRVSRQ